MLITISLSLESLGDTESSEILGQMLEHQLHHSFTGFRSLLPLDFSFKLLLTSDLGFSVKFMVGCLTLQIWPTINSIIVRP